MNVTVMKQIRFCAGHRLVGHEGRCANLHGHNYLAQIFVTGNETDALGRLVDFSVINRLFKGWIDDHWDHGMLIWEQDVAAMGALKTVEPNRVFALPYNPTAENMARYLLQEVAPELLGKVEGYQIQVSKVVVWETENSAAEVSLDAGSANGIRVSDVNLATS